MDEPLAAALKFGFLAVLYLFLLWVARSASRDLARAADPGAVDGAGRGQPGPRGNPPLEEAAAMGHQPGRAVPLQGGLALGRSSSDRLPIDAPFARQTHPRM